MKKCVKLAVGIVFTVLFLYLSYRSVGKLDLKKVVTYPVNYFLMALSAFFFIVTQFFRSLAWSRGLRRELDTGRAFQGICLGMATSMVMPFKMGEAVRVAILGGKVDDHGANWREKVRKEGVLDSYYTAGINIVLERLLDVVILVILAAIAVFFIDFHSEVKEKITFLRNIILIGGAFGVLFLGGLWWIGQKYRFRSGWIQKMTGVMEKIAVIRSPGILVKVLGYLVLSWLSIYLSTTIGLMSIGIGLNDLFPMALVVLILTNVAILLPTAPGGLGVFQYACIYSLGLFGVDGLTAAVSAVLLHLVQYLAVLPLGLYFFVTWKRWRDISERIKKVD